MATSHRRRRFSKKHVGKMTAKNLKIFQRKFLNKRKSGEDIFFNDFYCQIPTFAFFPTGDRMTLESSEEFSISSMETQWPNSDEDYSDESSREYLTDPGYVMDKEDESTDSNGYMVDGSSDAWKIGKKKTHFAQRKNDIDPVIMDFMKNRIIEEDTILDIGTPSHPNSRQISGSESDMTFMTDSTDVVSRSIPKKRKTIYRRFKSTCSYILRKTCCCFYK